jgi:hypothetical protein
MKRLATILATAALFSVAPAVAHADPGSDCEGLHDPRLCSPSKVFWCPSSQQMVTWLQPCSNYVVGPYAPGVPSNDGNGPMPGGGGPAQ